MSESSTKAVFLSYASQDKASAQRICDALRSAGLEVWFDVNELVGGDVWDQKIRRQIKECALFVPIISANTNARPEGYFRLEWKLAVDRSHLLADDHPFLFPVVIGDVNEATARVPDKFRDVQWTRMRFDETPGELAARVSKLLTAGATWPAARTRDDEGAGDDEDDDDSRSAKRRRKRKKESSWTRKAWSIVGLSFAVYYLLWNPIMGGRRARPDKGAGSKPPLVEVKLDPDELIEQAKNLRDHGGPESLRGASELAHGALKLEAADEEAWALAAQLDVEMVASGKDTSDDRKEQARSEAARALALDSESFEARLAQAMVLAHVVATPAAVAEAVLTLQELQRKKPERRDVAAQLKQAEAVEARLREMDPPAPPKPGAP